MALAKMSKISVCARKKDRSKILDLLQQMGVMEIETKLPDDLQLEKTDTTESRASFVRQAQVFENALSVLGRYAPEKKGLLASLDGGDELTQAKFNSLKDQRIKAGEDALAVVKLDKEIDELRAGSVKDEVRLQMITPWLGLDVPMEFTGTKTTSAYIGTLPGSWTRENLLAAIAADLAKEGSAVTADTVPVDAEVLSSANDASCIYVLCLKKDEETVYGTLRSNGFARPVQAEDGVPAETAEAIKYAIEAREDRIEKLGEKIAGYAQNREVFKVLCDYYQTKAEKYRMIADIPHTDNAIFFEGWVPTVHKDKVAQLLQEKFSAVVETEEAGDGDMPPTLLKNNKISASVESVLESYGLPQKGRLDPTTVMSFFYIIFFGMMLSDAGYGIIMAIGCGIVLLRHKRMAEGMQKMLRLFFWCGLSTTFWGFMYGGFFGDLIEVVAKTFFGYTGDKILKPLWFEPLNDPMKLLIYCMLFGLIHLLTGLLLKGVELLRDKDFVGFFSEVVSWFLLILGLTLMLVQSDIFASMAGSAIVLPDNWALAAKIMAAAGAIIILTMSARDKKNIVLRLALGLYDIYGVTSWLSDVLSYSRLLALGLATGVIASVINMMAAMVAGGVIGPLLFIIVIILGHTLNLAINVLGAYVHTNRLQFVEFFSKFYDGGGRPFTAFKRISKYTQIKEDN